jgi:hypothetical protein
MVQSQSTDRAENIYLLPPKRRYGGSMSWKTPEVGDIWRYCSYTDGPDTEGYFLIGAIIDNDKLADLIPLSKIGWRVVPTEYLQRNSCWEFMA